jgi:hypothetical protein
MGETDWGRDQGDGVIVIIILLFITIKSKRKSFVTRFSTTKKEFVKKKRENPYDTRR